MSDIVCIFGIESDVGIYPFLDGLQLGSTSIDGGHSGCMAFMFGMVADVVVRMWGRRDFSATPLEFRSTEYERPGILTCSRAEVAIC